MTEVTDYDWYIKTHPDYLPGTKEIIDSFITRYPKFTLLPSDASHHQLIAEGIDCALTSYGTIAFEYAALGMPVINASQNNPHIAYDFNVHARDVEHYRALLADLPSLKLKIDIRKVYEYYFMRNIFNTENMFFDSYNGAVKELGGYDRQFTAAAYDRWLKEWSPERHAEIVSGDTDVHPLRGFPDGLPALRRGVHGQIHGAASMIAVILAGGLGTRISEETHLKPKPMIEIGGKPILWHIMKIYSAHGVNDFIICCGYKGYVIKEYFANYFLHTSDVTFDMATNDHEGPPPHGRAVACYAGRHRRRHHDGRPPQARRGIISKDEDASASPTATA